MLAIVHWAHLKRDDDPRWDDKFCLYAYLHASRNWLLYVGKADYATVWQRYRARDKDALFNDIRRRYGTDDVRVLHGIFAFPTEAVAHPSCYQMSRVCSSNALMPSATSSRGRRGSHARECGCSSMASGRSAAARFEICEVMRSNQ